MAGPRKESFASDKEASLGWIVGVFGYHGEIRVYLHNRDSVLVSGSWDVTLAHSSGSRRVVNLSTRSGAGARIIGRVKGVSTEADARALMDHEILVPRDSLPEPSDGEFYHHELLGLRVVDQSGGELGLLTEIQSNGPIDIWVVGDGDDALFILATGECVVEVNLVDGLVVVENEWNSTF
jgi:16S rRNA processing protein RimM